LPKEKEKKKYKVVIPEVCSLPNVNGPQKGRDSDKVHQVKYLPQVQDLRTRQKPQESRQIFFAVKNKPKLSKCGGLFPWS
jgi:hypothetical protein